MKNYIKKLALIGGLILALGAYSGGNFTNDYSNYEKAIYESYETSKLEKILKEKREKAFEQKAEEQSSDKIKLPYYKLAPNSCSEYAILSAKKLFNKKYTPGDAWDLKYDNKIVYQFKENETTNDSTTYESIKDLIINETLKPGMIIVTRRDMKPKEYRRYKSYGTPGRDKKGNKIEDTHVILYIGLNDKGEEEFIHNWNDQREKITIRKFKDRKNLKPILILDSPDKTAI